MLPLSGRVEKIDHETFVDLCSRLPAKEIKKHLEWGADANLENSMGVTPIMAAALLNPDPEAITLLVGSGADSNKRFSEKELTPLMLAIEHNDNTQVLEALIRAGADVNAADSYGFTPLFHAIWKRGWDGSILEMLLVAGADVNAKDIYGHTVLMNAALANRSPGHMMPFPFCLPPALMSTLSGTTGLLLFFGRWPRAMILKLSVFC